MFIFVTEENKNPVIYVAKNGAKYTVLHQAAFRGHLTRRSLPSPMTLEEKEASVMGYRDTAGTPLVAEYLHDRQKGRITRAFYSTILYGPNTGDTYPRFNDGTINMYNIIREVDRKWPNYFDQDMPTYIHDPLALEATPYFAYLENVQSGSPTSDPI